ncbi:MAG: PAS domain-containing protein, partial [Chloroflexota bacterium]|nr:PAS domain-containing protein [Chloroflexota bacterium]
MLLRQWLKCLASSRNLERALRESKERYQFLADNAPDVIFRYRLSPEPGFEYISPACIALTGYTPEELCAEPSLPRRIIHPEDRPLLERGLRGEGLSEPFVLRWIHKDGRVVWAEQRHTPIYDGLGKPIAVMGIARDITKQKEIEGALKGSEGRYRTLVDTMHDGLAVVDENRVFTYANPRYCEITGYSLEEFLGRPSSQHPMFDEEDQRVLLGEWEKRLRGEASLYSLELM